MSYLVDTDICIYALNGSVPKLEKKFRAHLSHRLCVSTLTEAELYYGAMHSAKPQANWQRVTAFLKPLEKISFDSDSAIAFAQIRQELRVKGKPSGIMDMLIAAVARCRHLTVVTNNTKHFKHIPQLVVENWMQ